VEVKMKVVVKPRTENVSIRGLRNHK
jgi:hypothetical protein